jgi:hypothetical protein
MLLQIRIDLQIRQPSMIESVIGEKGNGTEGEKREGKKM